MTGIDSRGLMSGALQVFNLAAALVWWRVAPGPDFEARTTLLLGFLCLAWAAVVASRRRRVSPRETLQVIGLGVSLPVVWMVAIVMCEVTVVYAITMLIFGVFFLALCPLILWAAFLITHRGSHRVSGVLCRSGAGVIGREHAA